METLVPVFMAIIFAAVIIMLTVHIVRPLARRHKDAAAPVREMYATVLSKRTHVAHPIHRDSAFGGVSTAYFVTFALQDGHRVELRVKGQESGLLHEGDHGLLIYQGTRLLKFIRKQ